LEALSGDPQLEHVLNARVDGVQATPFTSEVAMSFGRIMLRSYDVDWAHHGFDGATFDEIVELCIRTFHSLFVDPGRWRSGLGRLLLMAAEDMARREGSRGAQDRMNAALGDVGRCAEPTS